MALVSVKDRPIERVTEQGLVINGEEYAFDCLVFATGFDAMTGRVRWRAWIFVVEPGWR